MLKIVWIRHYLSHWLDLDSNILVKRHVTNVSLRRKLFSRNLHIYLIEFIFTSSNIVCKCLKIFTFRQRALPMNDSRMTHSCASVNIDSLRLLILSRSIKAITVNFCPSINTTLSESTIISQRHLQIAMNYLLITLS